MSLEVHNMKLRTANQCVYEEIGQKPNGCSYVRLINVAKRVFVDGFPRNI